MNRIFCYELRRLLWNKIFLGILVVCLGFGMTLLTGDILFGIANTAPFSTWSFGYYLSRLMPVICLGELFFLSFFAREQDIRILIQSTPVNLRKYAAVRCGAVIIGTLFIELCVLLLFIGFYTGLFGRFRLWNLLLPAVLTFLPPTLFCLGAGWQLGRIKPAFLYMLMAALFLMAWIPLPQTLELFMGNFYSEYPQTLGAVDPEFTVPVWILCQRTLYGVLGIVLLLGNKKSRAFI